MTSRNGEAGLRDGEAVSGPGSFSDSEKVMRGGEVVGVDTRSKLSWGQVSCKQELIVRCNYHQLKE